jgi:hypothetical protein
MMVRKINFHVKNTHTMPKTYLTDVNRKHCYENDRIWITGPKDTPIYGTLKLTPKEDEYSGLYKWSVVWEDLGELYWTELIKLNKVLKQ